MTIEQKAHEAHNTNRALKEKYHIPYQAWIDWFTLGYRRAEKDLKALEIQEKEYTWHDLAVNRDDLPQHREVVLVKLKFDTYHYAVGTYSQIDGEWYLRDGDEFYQTNKEVIKWQNINE